MAELIQVICPHCQQEQSESKEAISTFCRSCGQHIAVREVLKKKSVHLPKMTKTLQCRHCGYEVRVVPTAISTQCINCSAYLDLKNHRITGLSSEKLFTYGEIYFAPGSKYKSMEVRAYKIRVAGTVQANLFADEEIELAEQAIISGRIEAPLIKIAPGAQAKADFLSCEKFEVKGGVQFGEALVSEHLHIFTGGNLTAERVKVYAVEVETGGAFSANVQMLPLKIEHGEDLQLVQEEESLVPVPEEVKKKKRRSSSETKSSKNRMRD